MDQKTSSPAEPGTIKKSDRTVKTSLYVATIAVFVLLQAATIISLFSANSNNKQLADTNKQLQATLADQKKLLVKLTPTPTVYYYGSLDDLKPEFEKVFAGSIQYISEESSYSDSKKPAFYYKSPEIPYGYKTKTSDVTVEAFKYTPGYTYQHAYEGGKWTMDMDAWVSSLTNQSEGKYHGVVYDDYWGNTIQQPSDYRVAMFGKKKYVVSSVSFTPGGIWDTKYQTYDAKNKQIVVITVTFASSNKSGTLSENPDVQSIFRQIESLLEEIN
jgi:hypothetical protein